MYLKDCQELAEKQKEAITQEIFNIYEYIRTKQWDALSSGKYCMECLPEDVEYEINDYYGEPSEVSFCEASVLAETIRPGKCRDNTDKWETLSLMWLNGQESDLSMRCEFTFKDEVIVTAELKEVHVF